MDATRLQIHGRRPRGGAAGSREGGKGGAENMGRGITAGEGGLGGGGDGLGACAGVAGLC